MKRIVISLLVATGLVFGTLTLVGLALFRGDTNGITAILLYWPWLVTDSLGYTDCGGTDGLSPEKFACIRMALIIDLFLYPTVMFVLAYLVNRILLRRLPNKSLDASGASTFRIITGPAMDE